MKWAQESIDPNYVGDWVVEMRHSGQDVSQILHPDVGAQIGERVKVARYV